MPLTRPAAESSLRRLTSQILPTIIVLGLLAAGWWTVHEINTTSPQDTPVSTADEQSPQTTNLITLPDGKLRAAALRFESVFPQKIQQTHEIPGRLGYDESKHINLMAPVGGILAEVLGKPGDHVEEGQLLALISSPEIGLARSQVLKLEAEAALVERTQRRATQVSESLQKLLHALDQRQSVEEIDSALAEEALGTYRQDLLSAYSKLLLAAGSIESSKSLGESGAIAGRTIRERESAHQVALAEYRSVREKVAFQAQQLKMQAEIDLADAERRATLARQQRDSLLGYEEREISDESAAGLSRFEVRAPFAGTIESRSYARSERVAIGDSLFVLADTRSLYVAADIRENDWPAIALKSGETISVSIPAVPDQEFTAVVSYVGREVSVETNSIPLVALIENREGSLRPGMFVRVIVPVGTPREALAVRPQSILRHEDQDFVFVTFADDSFQQVDVTTGVASEHWVEITGGLHSGQSVVTDGAFLLKSELLLDGEAE